MQVSKQHLVERMASKDRTRPALAAVYLRVSEDSAHLEATDSYGLVRVPVDLDADDARVSGYVPVEALKAARKNGGHLTVGDETVTAAGVTYPRGENGQYPNIPQLLPEWSEQVPASTGSGESYVEIGLDADILQRLASALGGKGNRVRLTIQCRPGASGHVQTTLRPVCVRSMDDPAATGLLMPVRLGDLA